MVTKTPTSALVTPSEKSNPTQVVVIVLLIASLLLNTLSLYFLLGYSFDLKSLSRNDGPNPDSSVGIKRVLLDLEYAKVGGKENYDLLQKYTQMQIKEQIPSIKKAVDGGAMPGAQQPTQPAQGAAQ